LEIDQEVESFFLRYAQEIRVLEPNELVEKIKMGLKRGMEVYN
jgi:predicted DNA-binding transcriptional regulator YafY